MTTISLLQSLLLESVQSGDSSLRRVLQSSTGDNNSNNGASGAPASNPGNAYQFVALLMWYISLVLCCIIPTCCAYRRRRLVEQQAAQQRANLGQIDLFNLEQSSQIRRHNPERLQQERLRILTDELKGTTMVRYTYSEQLFLSLERRGSC
jgi:hypothetical protein